MMLFSRETLTLDMEGTCLRWLTVSHGQVKRWGRIVLAGAPSPDVRLDPGRLGSEIAEIMEQESLPKKRVVASVSAQRAIFRTLSLPSLNRSLLDSAVQRKLRQEIPLQPQETDLSWTIIRETDDELEVFVVAIPREEIDYQMEILRAANVRPIGMDVKPLALIRAVNQSTGLVVCLEDLTLTIVVIVDGVPQVVRTVPLGASAPGPDGRLELTAQELTRTTKFYNESHKTQPLPEITALYLAGSSFNLAEMVERMRTRSPYQVTAIQPPLACPPDLSIPEFSVNLGLALRVR